MEVLLLGFFWNTILALTRLQDLSVCPKAHSNAAGLLHVDSFAPALTIGTE